ncbi:orotidine-5'-phosphate decarboxylase [Alteribacter lacisalsi]|uniref:Orotidine 5'-phosphate decarboxylase n=1 Tax=Alteribacter lacisalsi TaxID=2045244 RepID=A0A2W0HAX6_9BACI|nr:orotidine-5'-phosphate decarboxylase [Alteribacter lacisalsi]PYZ97956.1 orotidine-5'-phosphate decarboxylase [Alteribacter lacisalsi]
MRHAAVNQPVIVALDFPNRQDTKAFLSEFKTPLFVKVGMELFYREGPAFIHELKEDGHQVFLDLKLHDIPATVERAMRNLASLNVDLVNVHAQGGTEMMKAALRGLNEGTEKGRERPLCIAVTQLTSTNGEMVKRELGISEPLEDNVLRLAGSAREAGLDGIVCSAWESRAVAERFGDDFLTVTPGIRRLEDSHSDQKRVVTPAQAKKNRAGAIVVGRGITRTEHPAVAYEQYETEWRNS